MEADFCGMLKKAFNVFPELQINLVLDTKVCLLNLKLPVSWWGCRCNIDSRLFLSFGFYTYVAQISPL